jgi:hypothetical protein
LLLVLRTSHISLWIWLCILNISYCVFIPNLEVFAVEGLSGSLIHHVARHRSPTVSSLSLELSGDHLSLQLSP